MRTDAPVVVVLGIVGWVPFAGVGWQALHYLEGLRRCGCDVYYVEDTGNWPYDPEQDAISEDCRYAVRLISRMTAFCGMEDRWAYRSEAEDGKWYGLSSRDVQLLWRRADALINLTGATVLRDEHLAVPVRIYLETDPVLPQIEIAMGRQATVDILAAHTYHFTYGENFGAPDCGVPLGLFDYIPTRPPVILDWWPVTETSADAPFTTIASWQQSAKDIEWNGEVYRWSKHHEFLRLIDLPSRTRQTLELALACSDRAALDNLTAHGWAVRDALSFSLDASCYRDYILASRGEFTVAKDQNIRLRSGWFSDRSASYLAAGKPVVTQDTGFGNILPTGEGLFAFTGVDDAVAAIDEIRSDYPRHSAAARSIAEEWFGAERVVGDMLNRAGLRP